MAIINSSGKLSGGGGEYLISAGRTVFFRLISHADRVDFMTATADEDTGDLKAYHDQPALIRHTAAVFEEKEIASSHEKDRQGRAFVRATTEPDENAIKHLATLILDRLGIENDICVQAIREMRELHAELAIDDDEDAYLMDGMAITPDGRIVRA